MMTSSFDDRGLREYEYRVFSTSHTLQRDIQHAGLVTESVRLESDIKRMPKPHDSIPHNEAYNNLAKKLNRYADNPSVSGLGAWDKINKDVLTYFTSGLAIYADPVTPLTSRGYILDTRTRQLSYFDGTGKPKVLCDFSAAKDWVSIQTLFPTLFSPSYAVGLGLVSNYTTLQPEKYIQLIHQVLTLNKDAEFDRFIEPEFIPLFANLRQHAGIRTQLAKHDDPRTQEQLVADIVKGMYGKISTYLSREDINPAMRDVMINIIQYLDSGDYTHLADAMQKYDSAWLVKASNWLFSNEVDNTLNIIKEMRKSAFLDQALKAMVDKHYGEDRHLVVMDKWRQKIFGRKHEQDGDEDKLQDILAEHYGEGQTLDAILQSKIEELAITHIKDMDEESQLRLLMEHGIENLEQAVEMAVRRERGVENSSALGKQAAQVLAKAQEEILESVQQSILQKLTTGLLEQIANEVTGTREEAHDRSEDESESAASGYVFESHILDFESSEEEVNEMWDNCRVTKEAFKASLTAMAEKLQALQDAHNEVELPNIPLSQDLLLEGADQEDKTIIDHIRDSITRLQEKVEADKSKSKKTFYQTDCASLQNSINKILAYQFVGESTFMVTEEQRGVYNDVGSELTDILNATQKQPKKDLEIMSSVKPVREEIHRLIAFHNNIREQLTGFQQQLRSIDQGTFFNDIQKFVAKGAALDTKQLALQALLDELTDCQDVEFNVLAPENEWQRKVCAAVTNLTESRTELVDELQDVLLHQQSATAEGRDAPKPREYKKVTPKKDAIFAGQFEPIMAGIKDFAETLHSQEESRLATYFKAAVPLATTHNLGMFGASAHRGSGRDDDLSNDLGSGRSHGSGGF